jgi:nucleotide-binding universal stress UspA family protein
MIELKNILIAVDFSDSSPNVVRQAMVLATAFGSEVTILHVYELPDYAYGATPVTTAEWVGTVKSAAEKELQRFLASIRGFAPNAKGLLRGGDVVEEVLAAIDEIHPDLAVVGTHGRRGARHVVLGSVAERIVRYSQVPVLTVRGPAGKMSSG